MNRKMLLLTLAAAATVAGTSRAEARDAEDRDRRWQGSIGVRTALIKGTGLDPFSRDDVFTQLSLGVSRIIWREGAWTVAGGLAWDTGSSQARARSADGHLELDRLSAVLDLRYQALPALYLFGRLAPGVLWGAAALRDPAPVVPLETHFRVPSADASAGLAVRVHNVRTHVAVWLLAEGGYGWTQTQRLALGPDFSGPDESKAGTLELPSLAARGFFGRGSIAITY